MRLRLPHTRSALIAAVAVGLVGVLALSSRWLEKLRLPSPDRIASTHVRVTSGADAGPGTLREALFAAARADRASRIDIDVAQIVVTTPLPPLINPSGVIVDASRSRTRLLSASLAGGPVLDIASPNAVILGLRIVGAPAEAVLIRSSRIRMRDVGVDDSQVGVYLVDGADALSISNSLFRRNGVGIHLPADSKQIVLQNNRFETHRQAAIWAVAPDPPPPGRRILLDVVRNAFTGDFQPLVLVNANARIERNVFEGAHRAATYVSGGATVVRGNRIRAGRSFGIDIDRSAYGLIADNEIDHNCAGGVRVRASGSTHVTSNRIYANGSGIVFVSGEATSPNTAADNLVAQNVLDGLHLIGASPIVQRNRLVQNRLAGLRLSALPASGRTIVVPNPRLEANIVSANGADQPRRDEYSPAATSLAGAQIGDCPWRLGNSEARFAALRAEQ